MTGIDASDGDVADDAHSSLREALAFERSRTDVLEGQLRQTTLLLESTNAALDTAERAALELQVCHTSALLLLSKVFPRCKTRNCERGISTK